MDSLSAESLADKLTPVEIKNKEFRKTPLGYSPKEVVEFLDITAKAWERVQKHEKDLLTRIRTLQDEIVRWKGREGEIEKLKDNAQKEADAIRAKAAEDALCAFREMEERANGIRIKTEEWLEQVIAEVEETQRQKRNFVSAFRSALDSHYDLLKRETDESVPLAARLGEFLREAGKSQSI